jgi:putative addiction module CopG family antidote
MRKTIEISEDAAALVQQKVDQGLYPDASAAIAEALRLLDEHDELLALRSRIQVGLDQMERGETIPWNDETKQRIIREGREAYERGDPIDPDVCP